MSTIEIIDAHHHLCSLSTASYPWLEGDPVVRYHGDDSALRRDYLIEDYLADSAELELLGARLVASVHVENGAADPMWESRWIDEVIAANRRPTVQVAKVDLSRPDARDLVAAHAARASVRGVRDILNWHPDPTYTHRDRSDLLRDPAWLTGFAALGHHRLSFDLQVFPDQLPDAARLAASFPATPIVLDHAGMPIDRTPAGLRDWKKALRLVAAEPNTMVKVSALGTLDHHWTEASIRRIVLDTIDVFGPDRTMFASNFPVDGLYSSFGRLYGAFLHVTSDFGTHDRAALFGGTAGRFYRLPLTAS